MPADLALLGIQIEGALDAAGRLRDRYGITIASSGEGRSLWIGAEVPDTTAAELTSAFQDAPSSRAPGEPPPALEHARQVLERHGCALRCKAGPTFVFPDDVRYGGDLPIERSDRAGAASLRHANPGNWHPVEWDELVDGRLGPWTMIVDGGRAVSICHTPRPMTARAAECGVWTEPAFRGRGYAAAVTAAWADIVRPSGRHLFYSTTTDNRSSQRVAERLRLRWIGWTWHLRPVTDGDRDRLHPLCSLRP
jgi:hypothetical protein